MQKVEGSNPFSRFKEGLHLQVFLWAQSAGAFASTGSHWVAAASRQREDVRKRIVCRPFVELEPVTFCGANHIMGSASEFTWLATGSPTTA
jgi:hypothetical protein